MVKKWYYSCPMGQAINTNGRNIQKPSERVLHSGGHFFVKTFPDYAKYYNSLTIYFLFFSILNTDIVNLISEFWVTKKPGNRIVSDFLSICNCKFNVSRTEVHDELL